MKRRATWPGVSAAALVLGLVVMSDQSALAQRGGNQQAGGTGDNQLVANDRVTVMRLTAAPALIEEMHITPQDVVAIQAGPGLIEMQIGNELTKGSPGAVWYLPKTVEHALFNRGTEPVDMIVVLLANDGPVGRPAAPASPRTGAEARANGPVIDNERVSVMRVPAPPGLRQDMHRSPQNMIAVQGTAGQIEVAVGPTRTAGAQWRVWYLPNTLEHAVFNVGSTPVEMTVITLK